jgi:Tfp pilus assembly protein PilE
MPALLARALTGARGHPKMRSMRSRAWSRLRPRRGLRKRRSAEHGVGLVEIAIVVVVVAIAGAVLYAYLGSTAKTLETLREEKPLSGARLVADRATLAAIRSTLQIYYGQNGAWPTSKDAVMALLKPPPSFQCAGNDFTYDPATGQVSLTIDELGGC